MLIFEQTEDPYDLNVRRAVPCERADLIGSLQWHLSTGKRIVGCHELSLSELEQVVEKLHKVGCQYCDEENPGYRTVAGHKEQCESCGGTGMRRP